MKKALLSMAAAFLMGMPAMAQWSADFAENNRINPEGMANYGYEIKTNDNGVTYAFMQLPRKGTISMRLQILDKDGVKLLPDTAMVLSAEKNKSYTKVNQHLMIDKDGNAIVVVSDERTGNEGYTVYKVDEKGNVLWSKQLGTTSEDLDVAYMRMTCTDDSCYVFSYVKYDVTNNFGSTYIEKLKSDGTEAWDNAVVIADKSASCCGLGIVDAGFSQTMVMYAKGSNSDLMVRLIDFDGSSVWEEDVPAFKGGFNTGVPVWVQTGTSEAPENGMFVYWMDANEQNVGYENRISYILPDGTYGFSTGEEGTIISHDTDNSREVPSIYYNKDEKAIYFAYREFNQAHQSYQGIFIQKMSLDGELLWGANGKAVIPIQDTDAYSYASIQGAGEGKVAVFYMKNEGATDNSNVNSYMVLYDKDGNMVQDTVNVSRAVCTKYSLESSPLIDGKYFLLNWEQKAGDGVYPVLDIMIQRVFLDGSATGIKNVTDGKNSSKLVRSEYFTLDGQRIEKATKGIAIERSVYSDGTVKTQKIMNR